MKFAFGIFVFLWLLCGVIGAWMLDELDAENWKLIARGPITLVQGIQENPVSIPGMPD